MLLEDPPVLETYANLAERALRDEPPTEADSLWILEGDDVELLPLLQAAFEPRRRYFGREVMVQILNNVQNGLCPEDCSYCSQSKDSEAKILKYTMKADEDILAGAEKAARAGASRYCMAISGRGPSLERTRKLAGCLDRCFFAHAIYHACDAAGIAIFTILIDSVGNLFAGRSGEPHACGNPRRLVKS